MKSVRVSSPARVAAGRSISVLGFVLGILWGAHAAGPHLPVPGTIRLFVVIGGAAAFIMWRTASRTLPIRRGSPSLINVGLVGWFAAASLSTILNWNTNEVFLTYCAVFLVGAGLYCALSGITVTHRDLEWATVGLAIGALFPLVAGLQAFGSEWGWSDATTVTAAYRDLTRMASFETVTFGNRGNTAAFVLITLPLVFAVALDRSTRLLVRTVCLLALVPMALTLFVVQVRAAFLTVLAVLFITWMFKLGTRWLPVLAAALLLGWLVLLKTEPDAATMMSDQILAAAMIDTQGDVSVQQRADAINEGIRIAERNWLLGVGPGGSLTFHSHDSAHQFHVQQAMETGILGLLGSLVLSIGVLVALGRTVLRERGDEANRLRFALLVGPAAYLVYSTLANAAMNSGSLNTWTVLTASMLGMVPPLERRRQEWTVPAALRTPIAPQPTLPRGTF